MTLFPRNKVTKELCKDILIDCLEKHILGYDESLDTITLSESVINISEIRRSFDNVWFNGSTDWKSNIDNIVFIVKTLALEMHR